MRHKGNSDLPFESTSLIENPNASGDSDVLASRDLPKTPEEKDSDNLFSEKSDFKDTHTIDLWEPEVIEGASVGTFQGRIPKGEKRFGRYEWGHVYSPVRIACFCPSLWPVKRP